MFYKKQLRSKIYKVLYSLATLLILVSKLIIGLLRFRIPFIENKVLKFNAALFLLALAFIDNMLFRYNSLVDL